MKKFLNISSFFAFKSEPLTNVVNDTNVELEEYEKHVEVFKLWLKNKDFAFCYKMIKNGFNPPVGLKAMVDYGIEGFIGEDQNNIFKIQEDGIENLEKKLIHKWIIYNYKNSSQEIKKEIIKHVDLDEVLVFFQKEIEEKLKKLLNNLNIQFVDSRWIRIKEDESFKESSSIFYKFITNSLLFIEENINSMNLKKFTDYKVFLADVLKEFYAYEHDKYKKANESKKKISEKDSFFYNTTNPIGLKYISAFLENKVLVEKLSESHMLERESIIASLKEKNISKKIEEKVINDFFKNQKNNFNNLSEDIKLKIKQISEKHLEAINDKNLNPEILRSLKILFEEKLPSVVSRFLSLDDEYKKSLKNTEGKNAEELINESLDNILDSFNVALKNLAEVNVSNISIENRHIKTIRSSI